MELRQGGMSREELETLMHEKNEELKTDVLAVKSADGVIDEAWKFSDFSVHYKDDEIDKALKAGRDGNIAKIWYDRWHALVMGDAVHWMASYDDGALGNKVKALASEYGKLLSMQSLLSMETGLSPSPEAALSQV